MNRWLRAALVLTALAIGLALLPRALTITHHTFLGRLQMVSIGWAFIAAGLGAWSRRPDNNTGRLLVLAGFAWWMPLLEGTRVSALFTMGSALESSVLPVLFWLFLSFPDGRMSSTWSRWLGRAYVCFAVVVLPFSAFYDPAAFGCEDCPPHLNLLLVRSEPGVVRHVGTVVAWTLVVELCLLIATMATRWARASRPRRRVLTPVLVPGATWSVAYLVYLSFQLQAVHEIYAPPESVYTVTSDVFLWSLLAMPLAFLAALTRYPARRARISDLVVELGRLPASARLEDALRKTLRDPSLRVGFWNGHRQEYDDADGHPLALLTTDGASTTYVERLGAPLAAIVHDTALLDDPALVDAVVAAARLAVENEKLTAEVQAQLDEVRASRVRIVEAADEERRRVERDLHDGAQARLISLLFALQQAQSLVAPETADPLRQSLTDATREATNAVTELRELARGIHPSVLTEAGLAAAIEALAERAPLPITVSELPRERTSPRSEAAAYFVIAEAVTNAAKHAAASEVVIGAVVEDGRLIVQISDDGMGGADIERGSGLRGLADRISALDGELTLTSPPAGGTTLRVCIPCA